MNLSEPQWFNIVGAYKVAEKVLKNKLEDDFELLGIFPADILNLIMSKIKTFAAVMNQVSRMMIQ